jgi:phage tail protein X
MSYVRYSTQENDRWDLISQKFYGTPYAYERIIAANPVVPIRPTLPAGLVLAIPVIETAQAAQLSGLPPWKVGV